mmetsp:Transcript_11196/g.32713  ORF Transcript_11196/g.32713 Transcript_11196/m.32713 type:complete len:247 (+) Transcript_11196:434-1174(+)
MPPCGMKAPSREASPRLAAERLGLKSAAIKADGGGGSASSSTSGALAPPPPAVWFAVHALLPQLIGGLSGEVVDGATRDCAGRVGEGSWSPGMAEKPYSIPELSQEGTSSLSSSSQASAVLVGWFVLLGNTSLASALTHAPSLSSERGSPSELSSGLRSYSSSHAGGAACASAGMPSASDLAIDSGSGTQCSLASPRCGMGEMASSAIIATAIGSRSLAALVQSASSSSVAAGGGGAGERTARSIA